MAYTDNNFVLGSTDKLVRTNAQKRARTIILHILCWCVFLSLPILFNEHTELTPSAILQDLVIPFRLANNLFFIALFYFSYHIAIPALYFSERYLLLSLYFLGTFIVFFLINYSIMSFYMDHHEHIHHHGQEHEHHHREHHHGHHLFGPSFNVFMFIITVILAFASSIYSKLRIIYEEKLNTEISFLKAQINPHFLFNTLNSIYSLTLTKSDDASEAVLKLSGMMRYAVSDTKLTYVSLEKEINYINDYIELQKLRLADNVIMQYHFTGNKIGKQIAPFILIPFIENAFKYGVNAEENSNINIEISVDDRYLELRVINKKVTTRPNAENSVGLGIGTTKKRLQLLYPEKHTLTIHNDTDQFSVMLKLDLL